MSTEVETITAAHIIGRSEHSRGVVFFKVEITTNDDVYQVERRYTHFANLAHHIRGFPRFDAKPFPGKMMFNSQSELEKRQEKLEIWLQGIIEESSTTCPQMQRFVRLFALRSPKSMHSRALREQHSTDTLSNSSHSNSSLTSGGHYDRSRSADETQGGSVPMFSMSDIRPRSGSVCSDTDSNVSDLSDMSEGALQIYVGGGPHATTSSNISNYNDNLTTLSEDKPKTFTTPKKAPPGRYTPDGVEEVGSATEEREKLFEEAEKELETEEELAEASLATTPIEVKLARLGLDSNKMMVVTSPIKKRMPIKKAVSRPESPAEGHMPWWADWAVYFCGLPTH